MNEEEIDVLNEMETREEVVENQVQETKTYSEEEVEAIRREINENNQKAWNKRWGQEKSKMEREYAQKDQLSNLLKEQTGKENMADLLDYSFAQYGVERPNISNSKDEEVLGKNAAKEILELDDETIKEEANRLAGKKRSAREQATFMELGNYLTSKKQEQKLKNEIKESGIDEDILNNQDFKDFMTKFNKDTSFKDIYNLYSQTHESAKKKPFSAGSVTGKKVKEESEFFTQEEFMSLTAEDLKNPKIYEKAMKSRINLK